MPTNYTKDWGTLFNAAAIVFSKDLNGLMKTDRQGSASLKRILEGVQSPLAVINALTAVDKINLSKSTKEEIAALPKNIKAYKEAMAGLETAKNNYIRVLDEALNANVSLYPNNMVSPTPLKTCCPDSHRQMKVLRAEIEALYARPANMLKTTENSKQTDKISSEKGKVVSKITGEDDQSQAKRDAVSEVAALKIFVLNFSTSFKSGMAKGGAVIQRIKTKPTLEVYNKEMNNGGRDISQNLNNIVKLKANPLFAKSSLAKKLPDPGPLAAIITPFADGAKRRLNNNATPADVKRHLEEFTAIYKRITETYADVIAGKLD